jgi:hypothetical protein
MKPRSFAVLAIAAVLSVVIALATYASNNRWSQAKVGGEPLLPDLAAQAPRIAKVEITRGEKTLALVHGSDGWMLASHGDYPAKPGAVRSLLIKLGEAELVEAKTRNKDRYGLLDLEDPAAKDTKAHLVRLLDDKGAAIAEVVVGKKKWEAFGQSRAGTYVRKPGDAQTWLVNADIDARETVPDWVQSKVLDLGSAKIASVTVESPGQPPLKVERSDADKSKHTLAAIPEGKKLKKDADVEGIVRAAGTIELQDVRKADSTPAGDVSVVQIAGDGGLAVTLRLHKQGDDTWVSIAPTGSEGDAKKTAEAIAKRTQGWEFKVASSKAQAILKKQDDLLEAAAAPAPAPSAPAAGQTSPGATPAPAQQ